MAAFAQFDEEGDGTASVESMMEAVSVTNGVKQRGDLSHCIRRLQACTLMPGFVDVYSDKMAYYDVGGNNNGNINPAASSSDTSLPKTHSPNAQ